MIKMVERKHGDRAGIWLGICGCKRLFPAANGAKLGYEIFTVGPLDYYMLTVIFVALE